MPLLEGFSSSLSLTVPVQADLKKALSLAVVAVLLMYLTHFSHFHLPQLMESECGLDRCNLCPCLEG